MTTMSTTSSPRRLMPRTPRADRPIARTSFSSKRTAQPVARAEHDLVLAAGLATPISSSSGSRPMAMMPLGLRAAEGRQRRSS